MPPKNDPVALTPDKITAEILQQHNPELLNSIQSTAKTDGATAERQRIQDVLAQSMPGHEALVNTLAFDGKTTGAEAAIQVLAAEKKNRGTAADNHAADAAALAAVTATVDAGAGTGEDLSHLPIEDRCKAQWEKDKDLRAEFGSFETYVAWAKADANSKKK